MKTYSKWRDYREAEPENDSDRPLPNVNKNRGQTGRRASLSYSHSGSISSISAKSRPNGPNGANGANKENAEPASLVTYCLRQVPDGIPVEWAEGLARMQEIDLPRNVSSANWESALQSVERFLNEWAATAHAQGWNALECFGAHRRAPFDNQSMRGVALYHKPEKPIWGLTASEAIFKNRNGQQSRIYKDRIAQGGIEVWALGSKGNRENDNG